MKHIWQLLIIGIFADFFMVIFDAELNSVEENALKLI